MRFYFSRQIKIWFQNRLELFFSPSLCLENDHLFIRRMKWKKDHKLPNTKSKLPDTLPAATTSSPNLIKKEEDEFDPMIRNSYIKEESLTSESSN